MSQLKQNTTKLLPVRLVSVLLFSTFTIEFCIMGLFLLTPSIEIHGWVEAVIDSFILSVLLFPVLFFVLLRPLTRQVKELVERTAQLARTSERLTLVLDAIEEAVWDWQVQSGELYISSAWERILGYAPEELSGRLEDYTRCLLDEEKAAVFAALNAHMAGQTPGFDSEHRVRCKDGRVIWVGNRGRTVAWDEQGRPSRMVGAMRDITARKRAERELVVLNAGLEAKVAERTEELALALEAATEADRAKTEFMANVTHELRTPLNSIIGFAELLKDEVQGPLNAKQAQFAADILASGERLLALVEGILKMSRLDESGISLKREPVEISAALEARVAVYRKAAEARGVRIALEVAPTVGSAELDPTALPGMLDALLDNAIKFNRKGGTVAVSARRAGGVIEIVVVDTGIGIAREDLAKLFKPFVQLHAGLAREHGGLGLKLALARRLAELHGGTIEVESEPGKSSTFTLRLPIREKS